ncbi:hypothetical protein D3C74_416520 [compost metagenome]
MTSSVFDLMGESKESAGKRVELVVLRELCLMCGRMLGVFVFIAVLSVNDSPRVITWLMLLLGAAPLGSWITLHHLLKRKADASLLQ